ncbi:MAG: energy transducer TonB [Burkholderiaceae bacterium]
MRILWFLAALGLHGAVAIVLSHAVLEQRTRVDTAGLNPPEPPPVRVQVLGAMRTEALGEANRRTDRSTQDETLKAADRRARAVHAPPVSQRADAATPGPASPVLEVANELAVRPPSIAVERRASDQDQGPQSAPQTDSQQVSLQQASSQQASSQAFAAQSNGPGSRAGAAALAATPPQTTTPRVDASWAGNTPPPYPLAARRNGVQGKVRVDLLIEANGGVAEVRLRQSSGSSLLDHSVIQTVKRWKFVPASQQGQTIAAWYPAWEWEFRLEEGS